MVAVDTPTESSSSAHLTVQERQQRGHNPPLMAVPKYDLLAASTLTLQPSHISCPITQLALLNKVRMKRVNYLLQHYTSSESSTMNSALSTCGAGSILVRVEWTPLESQKLSEAHYHNFHYQMCRSWSYSKSYSEL